VWYLGLVEEDHHGEVSGRLGRLMHRPVPLACLHHKLHHPQLHTKTSNNHRTHQSMTRAHPRTRAHDGRHGGRRLLRPHKMSEPLERCVGFCVSEGMGCCGRLTWDSFLIAARTLVRICTHSCLHPSHHIQICTTRRSADGHREGLISQPHPPHMPQTHDSPTRYGLCTCCGCLT
jgi:hypothetical protein